MIRHLLAFCAALAIGSAALADTKAVYSLHNERVEIELTDNGDMRLSPVQDQTTYFLLIGGASYMAVQTSGSWGVIRLDDMTKALSQSTKRSAKPDPKTELTVEPHGQRQVNGRMGMVYKIKGTKQPEFDSLEFVISNDQTLAPLGQSLGRLADSFLTMVKEKDADLAVLLPVVRRIFALGTPIGGNLIELQTIETRPIDPKRLALPGPMLTLEQLIHFGGISDKPDE